MEFQIAMTLSLSNSFIMTKKGHFHIFLKLFEQFNLLQLSISLCLKCVFVIGHCGRGNITVPSVKTPELTIFFTLKARSRSEYSQICLVSAIISSLS